MGELRLYAVGLEEVRRIVGAPPEYAAMLSEIARRAQPEVTAQPARGRTLLGRLGPLFRRPHPALFVPDPGSPTDDDLAALLSGQYLTPDRSPAIWRLLETLVGGLAWGTTRLELEQHALNDLDFALTRGGVAAAIGVGQLIAHDLRLPIAPVAGLTVGYQPHRRVLEMTAAYTEVQDDLPQPEQRDLVHELVLWLGGFPHWAEVAPTLGRPEPDLVGFWAT